MDPYNIRSLTEDDMWEIEDELMGMFEGGAGGKSEHRGSKTSRRIKEELRENANENRVEEAKANIDRELSHFPLKEFNNERLNEAIEDYAAWVLKSLKDKYPHISNLDDEFVYTQSRSSGPGGQNVNKTSTAVTVRHLMTGMFSRSEDSREVIINKRTSLSKLMEKLEDHIKNWNTYLDNISEDKRESEIKSFVQDLIDSGR